MLEPPLNLDDDFLFAKLHGRWSKALVGDRLEGLIHAGNLPVLGRSLADFEVGIQDRAEVQKNLTLHAIRDIGRVGQLLDEPTRIYYRRFLERYFLENIKTLARHRYQQGAPQEIAYLLLESEYLPALPWDTMMQARTIEEFCTLLPETGGQRAVREILLALDEHRDTSLAETRIDAAYYERLHAATKPLPAARRQLARQLTGMEIDARNIVTAMRNLNLYHLANEELKPLLVTHGLEMTVDDILAAATGELADFVDALPPVYADVIRPHLASEPYRIENALWTLLYEKALAAFRDNSRPGLAPIAYPLLKRCECLNLGRLFEGLYLKVLPETIRAMMIGHGKASHV